MSESPKRVWLLTGCSSGLGHEMALAALALGDTVVATARDPSKLASLASQGALTARIDVTAADDELAAAVRAITQQTGGRIDVLVNNAGYILAGGVEEASRAEAQAVFDTNVFGQLSVLRAVLPVLRAQRSGVVANLGSIGGWRGTPGAGLYCATKACATVLAEALRAEVAHLGISVTSVEPGYTRTSFLRPGHRVRAERRIEELGGGALGETLESLDAYDMNQPGDPTKTAKFIVDALTGFDKTHTLPPRLVVGKDAYAFIEQSLEVHKNSMKAWEDLATATDCDS